MIFGAKHLQMDEIAGEITASTRLDAKSRGFNSSACISATLKVAFYIPPLRTWLDAKGLSKIAEAFAAGICTPREKFIMNETSKFALATTSWREFQPRTSFTCGRKNGLRTTLDSATTFFSEQLQDSNLDFIKSLNSSIRNFFLLTPFSKIPPRPGKQPPQQQPIVMRSRTQWKFQSATFQGSQPFASIASCNDHVCAFSVFTFYFS